MHNSVLRLYVRTCGEVWRFLLEPPDGGEDGDGGREAGVADDHGGGDDGDQEEGDAHGLARLQQLLHPHGPLLPVRRQLHRPPPHAAALAQHGAHGVVRRVQLVLRLVVGHQAHLGVPRDERVERERTACHIMHKSCMHHISGGPVHTWPWPWLPPAGPRPLMNPFRSIHQFDR